MTRNMTSQNIHLSSSDTLHVSDVWSFATSTLMMETKEISETSVLNSTVTRLIAPEDFTSNFH
jgi:hypothetical protein